ncbi:hypothetical protein PGT21_012616 [Puccinia graminis f. sp. tritici]|uniref:ATPase AAA-type core domain-containing protein n=1 Tax=Puccinia graminis f. sp. tritici TaxID=56615 RepID=A0A5B0MBU6_PUCGR|nr:hypothetical protein PGT21_012616 [Puccinia graminis f. sp. tritici]
MSKPITSFFLPTTKKTTTTTTQKTEQDEKEEEEEEEEEEKEGKNKKGKNNKKRKEQEQQQINNHQQDNDNHNKRLKSSRGKHKKKEKETSHQTINSSPLVVQPSVPITIDLTLDSPEAKKTTHAEESIQDQNKKSGKKPSKIIDLVESPLKEKILTKKCKTFADFEELRRQKIKRNTRPIVHPSWPSEDLIHQRFLDEPLEDFQSSTEKPKALRLTQNKGKKPLRSWDIGMIEDNGWMKTVKEEAGEYHPEEPETQRPTLTRLDLQPPVNLIRGLQSDPTYRHPLLARLLKLISWPHPGPIPHDLPSLRRQHHRPSDAASHLWTATFAPKRAAEILGDQNLQSAQTLKSWLLEIALKEATNSNHNEDQTDSSTQNNQPGNRKKGATTKRKKKKKQKAEEKKNQKRVIIRAVSPRKRRKTRRLVDGGDESDGLDDFIVADSDEDTIYAQDISISDSELGPLSGGCSPRKRQRSVSVLHPEFAPTAHHHEGADEERLAEEHEVRFEFEHLTNLILLKGPHGSGKSCAVQAVAQELGWEVFEVNPSQLRTRKEVDRLIGDVSRNHVLSCSAKLSSSAFKSSAASAPPLANPSSKSSALKKVNPFDKMMKATREQASKPEPQTEDIVIDEECPGSIASKSERVGEGGSSDQTNKKTKQSLILLEEVDIVYGQDKDFWAGVVELVSKSMRPVVMTCNDSSVIPVESLPVQTILEFSPAPVELVSGFLEVVCMIEGHLIDREILARFYREHVFRMPGELKLKRLKCSSTPMVELFQEPSLPVSLDPSQLHPPDLRRTLCQLQFLCQWAIGSRFSGVDWLDLAEDRSSKMLFSSNSIPPPSSSLHLLHLPIPNPLPHTPSQTDIHLPPPFERFGDHHFQFDWLHKFLAQRPPIHSENPNPPPSTTNTNIPEQTTLAKELEFLARAHEDLSFGDAYVDKDEEIEVEQFEAEIGLSSTDNVLIGSSTSTTTATNNRTIIETRRPAKAMPDSLGSSLLVLEDDEYFEFYDLEFQHVCPKRPFTGSHYQREHRAFVALRNLLFARFFALDLRQSRPFLSHREYLVKFFRLFRHDHLVQTRSEKLKEMDEYMDFKGSRAFVLPLKDYILDYCPLIREIFRVEYGSTTLSKQQKKTNSRVTRASALRSSMQDDLHDDDDDDHEDGSCLIGKRTSGRVPATKKPAFALPLEDPVLALTPDEILLFRNASDRFLV